MHSRRALTYCPCIPGYVGVINTGVYVVGGLYLVVMSEACDILITMSQDVEEPRKVYAMLGYVHICGFLPWFFIVMYFQKIVVDH